MLDPNTFLFMLLLRQVFYNECDAIIKFVIQCKHLTFNLWRFFTHWTFCVKTICHAALTLHHVCFVWTIFLRSPQFWFTHRYSLMVLVKKRLLCTYYLLCNSHTTKMQKVTLRYLCILISSTDFLLNRNVL